MKYCNIVGPDFYPRPARRYSTKVRMSSPDIPRKVKQDIEPERVPKGQQHQNWALVNSDKGAPTGTGVRFSMKALEKELSHQPKRIIKPRQTDSRKRIEKMRAMYAAKVAAHQQWLAS